MLPSYFPQATVPPFLYLDKGSLGRFFFLDCTAVVDWVSGDLFFPRRYNNTASFSLFNASRFGPIPLILKWGSRIKQFFPNVIRSGRPSPLCDLAVELLSTGLNAPSSSIADSMTIHRPPFPLRNQRLPPKVGRPVKY